MLYIKQKNNPTIAQATARVTNPSDSILSIVCGFSVMFDSILSVGLLTDAIPYLGNAAVIREIISGEQRMHDVLISVGSNMAISVILVWLTSKAFSEEKHMVSF